MAKKTATKKKAAPVKAAKPLKKTVVKPVKKSEVKPVKKPEAKPAKKPEVKAVKPAVKEKVAPLKSPASSPLPNAVKAKGKKAAVEEKVAPAKVQTVISMMEDPSGGEDAAKAEKVSKAKPVKIERGNVADEKAKWAELFKKYGKDKAVTYKMSETFTTMIPIQHKVLGWGFVLTNENDRLEVLFETGIRMLISNYKA